MITGVPLTKVSQNENKKLAMMYETMSGSVIGQEEAIRKVTKAIQRGRVGLKDPNRPIGSFIFLGPTGVGKTELAKQLAKYMFDSEDSLIRIDMSEYMEKFAISRLIGAPPGYVGHEDGGGQLTEKVRRRPYSVILLDEIEKAHPEVFNLLLQILDDGQLTDSHGRKVSFKNSVIIMTSNTGSRKLKEFGTGVGFNTKSRDGQKSDAEKDVIQKELKKTFAPEFLNRIDDVITFNSLDKPEIEKIIMVEIEKLKKRVVDLEFELDFTQEAIDNIVKNGFDTQYGARPLKRAIQKYVEDVLTEEIISNNPDKGSKLILDYNSEEDKMIVKINKRRGRKSDEKND